MANSPAPLSFFRRGATVAVAAFCSLLFLVASCAPSETIQAPPASSGYVYTFTAASGDTAAILSLQQTSSEGSLHHKCTAALIAPQWVLTAAHCVTPPPAEERRRHARRCTSDQQPSLGPPTTTNTSAMAQAPDPEAPLVARGDVSRYTDTGVTATVVAIRTAPGWSWEPRPHGESVADIAVVKLNRELPIEPIPLAAAAPAPGSKVLVQGWATMPDRCGDITPAMQQWTLTDRPCQTAPAPYEFCAATENKAVGPCQGTSGAPVMTLVNGKVAGIAGVYSRPEAAGYCGEHTAVFTSVAGYRGFIDDAMGR